MANVQNPSGAAPVKHLNGSPYNGQANRYCIPSTDGSIYNQGDFVKSASGCDADGVPNVQKAAAGNTMRGIIVGVEQPSPSASIQGTSLALETLGIPATKAHAYYVWVADASDLVFEIQDDGSTYPGAGTVTANQQSVTNMNANIVVANPSTTLVPLSATTLGASTAATTNTLGIKILGKVQRSGNDFGSAYVRWLCTYNLHELTATGTTGY